MQELSKADIAQEIHAKAIGYYKQSEQFGYKFLMELKKIRDDRLFTELGFKDFDQYTQQSFNYTRRTIDKRISAAETFGNDFENARSQLGDRKVQQIAQLPYDQREEVMQDGIDTEQGHKSVDEATTREIEEYKRKLKQSEEANKTLDGLLSEKADTINALEQQVKNKPKPEVVEKTITIEVKPDDYDELKRQASVADDLKKQREQSQSQINKLQKELNDLKSRSKYQKVIDTEEADRQHRLSVLKVETAISIYSLIRDIQDFLKKENVLRDISKVNGFDDESKNDLQEANDGLQRFVDEVNQILSGRKIVEGKFTE